MSLHPAQSTRITLYVNTHAQRERERRAPRKRRQRTHIRVRLLHFSTHKDTNFRALDSHENFPAFPNLFLPDIIEEYYKRRDSRANIDISAALKGRSRKGKHLPRTKIIFQVKRACSPKNETGSRVLYSYAPQLEGKRSDGRIFNLADTDWAHDRQVGEPSPLSTLRSLVRCRTTTGRRSPCTVFSILISLASLASPLLLLCPPFVVPYVRASLRSPAETALPPGKLGESASSR